ncbi:hypothetical protein HZS61_006046 [Fusarium oxysporum f. sp. conglutinans]|uniref:Zn(2)-C6 fungal-type domain-containing protein n=1 Tax=Fusarium oxysporum f. sp. conglutinans TaxID=100902 RepID=A0A8H6GBT5_FUSOX|nr:hypothetical protein HZS61_006046 [Fusarium oxysporum f. sp. conglutinans]
MAHEIPSRAGSSSNSNEYMHSTGASSQGSTWEEERENEQTSRRISIITTTLSCFQCRARKAKCDRLKPNCSRCVRLGDECVFPNSRQRRLVRKTNPAATLETRVARLEEIITQSGLPDIVLSEPISLGDEAGLDMGWNQDAANINQSTSYGPASNGIPVMQPTAASSQEDPFMMHELIGLGQFEQLPPSHLTERLVALYFDELNQDLPMLHRTRYVTSLHCPAHMRPPMSLQYAVLALAAATRQEFAHLAMPFYQRSRRYAEADEMKGQGEYFTTIAHTQCWCLLAAYESHQLLFSRASGAMADHFLVFSAYLAALIFLEDYMETKYLKNEQHLHYILNAMAQAGEKDLFSRSLAIQLASGMKHVGMDSRTIDRVQELPPTPVSIPILAKQDKASSHITFCSILPTKSDDYSISPRRG